MNILINASEIKQGGGMQVTDSLCRTLCDYPQHTFIVVISSYFKNHLDYLLKYNNVVLYCYDINKFNVITLLTGREHYLDSIVESQKIEVVINVFGPTLWVAKCKKITGFARAHLIMPESPYYTRMSVWGRVKEKVFNRILYYYFNRSTDVFFTENPMITTRVEKLFKKSSVTITNYYNQVFDNKELCKQYILPQYNGTTLLTISSYYPHKNLEIAVDILKFLDRINSNEKLRFVFSINEEEYIAIPEKYKNNFLFLGKVDISECPSLYEQSDIVFQPTLLECFTATYPEAMKMLKPIVTTDLNFARGLCSKAALYYDPLNAEDAALTIIKLIKNKELYSELVISGKEQLKEYDNYAVRSKKLISLCESLVK